MRKSLRSSSLSEVSAKAIPFRALFIFCMERLSQYITNLTHDDKQHLITLSKHNPKLSHLFFVDDLILFYRTTDSQVQLIKETSCFM